MLSKFKCENCDVEFNRKAHLIQHLNRKIPCVCKTPPIAPQLLPITPNEKEKVIEEKENKNADIEENDKYCCKFCNRCFSKKYNLERHINNVCNKNNNSNESNKLKEQFKEQLKGELDEFKQNLEIKMREEIKKELTQLKKDNEKLKKQLGVKKNKSTMITKSKPKSNTNINIVNNIVNNHNSNNTTNTTNTNTNTNTNNIVNFNSMDYSNMDKKLFINPLLNMKLFGKEIILKMVENIYINEAYPEYQNIIITDKNRGYVKVYNNGKWQTNNIHTINLVLDGIIEHSKTILDELFNIYSNNNQVKSRLTTSNKYVKLCDPEHLAELEDEQENDDINNSNQIKRCKDFRDMVYKDTINLFHDNKNILLKPRINKIIELE